MRLVLLTILSLPFHLVTSLPHSIPPPDKLSGSRALDLRKRNDLVMWDWEHPEDDDTEPSVQGRLPEQARGQKSQEPKQPKNREIPSPRGEEGQLQKDGEPSTNGKGRASRDSLLFKGQGEWDWVPSHGFTAAVQVSKTPVSPCRGECKQPHSTPHSYSRGSMSKTPKPSVFKPASIVSLPRFQSNALGIDAGALVTGGIGIGSDILRRIFKSSMSDLAPA